MGLFDQSDLIAKQMLEQQMLAEAQRNAARMNTPPAYMMNGLTQNGYTTYDTTYDHPAMGSGTVANQPSTVALLSEIATLKGKVAELAQALANPDRPVAVNLQALIDSMDMNDVAGRTKPPIDHLTMASVMDCKRPIDMSGYQVRTRDGAVHHLNVVGLIVEETGFGSLKPATYMIPTPSLTADKAFEAAADLIAHMVVERVLSKMEIDNDSPGNGLNTGNLR